MKAFAERNIKKYTVVITVDFEYCNFYVPAEAETPEQAQEYAINKLVNDSPIYRGHTKVYNVMER